MFPILGFPVSRNTNGSEDDDRKAVGEVDFFSKRNKASPSATHHDHHQHIKPNNIINNTAVKKEIIPPDEKPPNSNFHVNTGLQLANTGSDQSVVDDRVSSDAEDKRAKQTTELAQLQVELQRMNAENKKLKEMLTHVSGNYTALQMNLVALMQKNHHTENELAQLQVQLQRMNAENKKLKEMPTHVLNSMIDGDTQNGSPATTPIHKPTSMPGEFYNSGIQTIQGMTNQTGFTQGDANGAINYGGIHVYFKNNTIIFRGRGIRRGRRGRGRSDPPQPSQSCTSPPSPPPPPPTLA